jgi:hypothetical protein
MRRAPGAASGFLPGVGLGVVRRQKVIVILLLAMAESTDSGFTSEPVNGTLSWITNDGSAE